ncbi:MAG: hypothetical protein NW215_00665 [Hyphomicrobiales bacterium]|nr:hypothetical protein [Hyphomicrobiales bacterium]
MAFENLQPFADELKALRQKGKTLTQIMDLLATRGVETTPGTLSRYFRSLGAEPKPRELTPEESQRFESIALYTEILVELRARSEEQRRAIESLAGQLGSNTSSIGELEALLLTQLRNLTPDKQAGSISPQLLRQVWLRATLILAPLAGGIGFLLGRL